MSGHPRSHAPDMEGRIRVVVADDHPVVRSGIVHELERQPDIDVIGTAATGEAAFDQVQTLQPDVLALDLRMPGMRALEVVAQTCLLPVPPRVLMLTAYSEVEHVLMLLKAGATGYLLKDEDPSTISAAAIARRPWKSTSGRSLPNWVWHRGWKRPSWRYGAASSRHHLEVGIPLPHRGEDPS
jgi:CheY-like chemotaxis protein